MNKVLIIGSHGQLGRYLIDAFQALRVHVIEFNREQLDLTSTNAIQQTIASAQPDLLINASAYTAVDLAESESDLAFTVNKDAPIEMAKYCADVDIPFVHYSTDYVFSGSSDIPYKESDPTDPQGVYGESKLAGEQGIVATGADVYIFRTAWVYSQQGKNFFKTMLALAENRNELSIVNDQIGSPTYAGSIADASAKIAMKLLSDLPFQSGIYHMTCGSQTNWADFAKAIFSMHNIEINVNGIPTSEYPTPAKRPAFSVLDNRKLQETFEVQIPHWQIALEQCVSEKH